jgi:glycosyltransferase involved in cell wall biosynthesis
MLTTVILAKNEEKHIARAIKSVAGISDRCVVVDSGSTDRTIEVARELGAEVLEKHWVNYSTQFNWALDQLPDGTEWVLRLDADEYVTPTLRAQIAGSLAKTNTDISAMIVSRRMYFMGKPIRWGGVFPIRVARLFRYGRGRCENRWMDEHIIVNGDVIELSGAIIDDNHNSITWWTEKHNSYSSREAVDLLNVEFNFIPYTSVAGLERFQQAGVKRWLKEKVYTKIPSGSRALIYFFYRYILRLGFLDGKEGRAFHVLQGFWYRYLVDIKVREVKSFMRENKVGVKHAIREVLKINV